MMMQMTTMKRMNCFQTRRKYPPLEEVTDENNYDPLPSGRREIFIYKCRFIGFYSLVYSEKSCREEHSSNEGQGRTNRSLASLKSWEFLLMKVCYVTFWRTNERIADFKSAFRATLEDSNKYTYCDVTHD